MIPSSNNPFMMLSGVSPQDKQRNYSETVAKIARYQNKSFFQLPNQGPSVLPLPGYAGNPLVVQPTLYKTLDREDLYSFKANQFKETLPIKSHYTKSGRLPTKS